MKMILAIFITGIFIACHTPKQKRIALQPYDNFSPATSDSIKLTLQEVYGYKVYLFIFRESYIEVFYNHKQDRIEKIQLLDTKHSRMNFYADQIKVEYSRLLA